MRTEVLVGLEHPQAEDHRGLPAGKAGGRVPGALAEAQPSAACRPPSRDSAT